MMASPAADWRGGWRSEPDQPPGILPFGGGQRLVRDDPVDGLGCERRRDGRARIAAPSRRPGGRAFTAVRAGSSARCRDPRLSTFTCLRANAFLVGPLCGVSGQVKHDRQAHGRGRAGDCPWRSPRSPSARSRPLAARLMRSEPTGNRAYVGLASRGSIRPPSTPAGRRRPTGPARRTPRPRAGCAR